METYENVVELWKTDKETAQDLVFLTPDTVSLPYTSKELLLKRLRFQFHTLTAMQRGHLSDAV